MYQWKGEVLGLVGAMGYFIVRNELGGVDRIEKLGVGVNFWGKFWISGRNGSWKAWKVSIERESSALEGCNGR